MALTREDFLKRPRTVVKVADVPGYGDVHIVKLMQSEIARIHEIASTTEKKKSKPLFSYFMMVYSICDADGKREFSGTHKDRDEADYEAALELQSHLERPAAEYLMTEVLKTNGYPIKIEGKDPEDSVAETAKN